MKSHITKFLATFTCMVSTINSCGCSDFKKDKFHNIEQNQIVSGPGELSFTEKYDVDITLPISEDKLFMILDRMKLKYSSCGVRGGKIDIPSSRQVNLVDISRAKRCYEIDGSVNFSKGIGERYRAFSDKNREIFYIENAFSYTGP